MVRPNLFELAMLVWACDFFFDSRMTLPMFQVPTLLCPAHLQKRWQGCPSRIHICPWKISVILRAAFARP